MCAGLYILPFVSFHSEQGCDEKHDSFTKDPPYFTAFRSRDYGYTRMKIYNSTHVFMDQVSVDKVRHLRIPVLD